MTELLDCTACHHNLSVNILVNTSFVSITILTSINKDIILVKYVYRDINPVKYVHKDITLVDIY